MWDEASIRRRRSSVFYPSGQVGLVCDGRVACLNVMGSTAFVVVSTLRQFTVYDAFALKVAFVSLPMLCDVKHIATKFEHVFVVLANNSIFAFHRYDQRQIKNCHSAEILGILSADNMLVTFSRNEVITYEQMFLDTGSPDGVNKDTENPSKDSNKSEQWHPKKTINMPDGVYLEIVVPLVGFKNKVLLGSCNGQMHLCNVSTGNIIHTFQFSDAVVAQQMKDRSPSISAVVQSQLKSNSIVAVGYRSGDVLVVDIKADQVLGSLKLSKYQQHATSLMFVYDAMGMLHGREKSLIAGEVLLIGTENGDIVIFDLSGFRTFSVIKGAHVGPIKHLMYVEKTNSLVTAGTDNSLVLWSMDSDKHLIREFKSRRGLIGEVNLMQAYDADELDLLVCSSSNGVGYLGKASTMQQVRCNTFSTTVCKQKLRKITAIASCYQRHYDWPNIATCHQNTHVVHLWSGHRGALAEGVIKAPNMAETATAVCISSCGNYVVVGYINGQLHLFNLQSTNHEDELVIKQRGERSSAHESRIITLSLLGGVQLVSICDSSKDRTIKTWDISTVSLKDMYEPDLPKGAYVHLAVCGSLLTALACSDGVIYLVDVIGKMVIRTIGYGKVTSMAFHPNGSWFIATASDSTMVAYDILAACYVEYARFTGQVLAVSIDSSGAFLNVAIENAPGIIMRYANKHVFEIDAKTMLYKELGDEPVMLQLPCLVKDDSTDDRRGDNIESAVDDVDEVEMRTDYRSSAEPLADGMISLSGLSSGQLQSILFLDEIKEKSKPKEPPKAAEDLPFFIPTTYKDGQLVFVDPQTSGLTEEQQPKPRKKLLHPSDVIGELESLIMAKDRSATKYEDIMRYLLNQTPAGVHLALSTLSIEKKNDALLNLLKFFEYYQSRKTNSDALQVFLYIFLKYHGEAISNLRLKGVKSVLERLSANLHEDNQRLQQHFDRISCFIKFFTHLQME
ncbi:WD domain, G-beta repeat containing protein [Babesia divergens]|uniref:WD domain, G-beta repeat containing protein n=1 Tax=Babesia divergens TaxID=32595 RepID=A0AAD9GAG6_BABDI|nr:WD domain, G-beta repeat containing protein [Babesia divergens]